MTGTLAAVEWGNLAAEAARSCFFFSLVVIPLVALYELLREVRFFARTGKRLEPWAAMLHLSPRAIFPLFAGVFLGLLYGAGIIISVARERVLTRRDVAALSIFLASCHAILEDTLVFVVLGASLGWIIVPRVIIALAATRLVGSLVVRGGPAKGGSA